MKEIFSEYIQPILGPILTAILGYIGLRVKKYLDSKMADLKKSSAEKLKSDTITKVVQAVEQIYQNLHGEAKFQAARQNILKILSDNGVEISDTELGMGVEAAVRAINQEKGQEENPWPAAIDLAGEGRGEEGDHVSYT